MWLLKLWKIIVFVFDSIFLRSAGQCSVKLSLVAGGIWAEAESCKLETAPQLLCQTQIEDGKWESPCSTAGGLLQLFHTTLPFSGVFVRHTCKSCCC